MRNSNKNIYIIMIAVLLLGVTIGYAVINSTLNINGKSNIRKNTWNVHFENISVANGSVEAEEIPTIYNRQYNLLRRRYINREKC